METPLHVLYEHATGYSLFRVKEFEEVGQMLPQVEASVNDLAKFGSVVSLEAFAPFQNTEAALANCNAITEGLMHADLLYFLENNLPREKKAKTRLGLSDSKLAAAIVEALPTVGCVSTGVVPEVLRGVRLHFASLVKGLPRQMGVKAQLGLGHSYSRAKVKFNVHRVDNMIIQAIALLDQLDKNINTFGMRIKEWYSYHFPELARIVPDQYKYCRCALIISDRKAMTGETLKELNEVLEDDALVVEIEEGARMSMGMDITPVDLINIDRFSKRLVSLADFRRALQDYLHEKMDVCAPNLRALIGDQVGARLISHAGSLTNLAKYPASTVQILGAEKALFRALKTRGNTPKYGLLFHSTFIGRAAGRNKGRISRFLANKCSMATRLDCFMEPPVATFGEHLRQQVEDRLKYFETGEIPRKNYEVMGEATVEATAAQNKLNKQQRKKLKKKKKLEEAEAAAAADDDDGDAVVVTKKAKKRKVSEAEEVDKENGEEDVPEETPSTKKKKRKRSS